MDIQENEENLTQLLSIEWISAWAFIQFCQNKEFLVIHQIGQ